MNTLLLIVDVQQQFIPDDAKGEEFCRAIEILQKKYKYVAVSKFINTPDSFWVQYLQWNKMMKGDKTTDLAFKPIKEAYIYENNTFTSYSPALCDYISKNEIKEVHLCGVDTDACIIATAYDLWDAKVHFRVLIDHCISSAGENAHSGAQHIMNKNFGFEIIKTTGEMNQ